MTREHASRYLMIVVRWSLWNFKRSITLPNSLQEKWIISWNIQYYIQILNINEDISTHVFLREMILSFPHFVAFARSAPIIISPRDIYINQQEYMPYIVFVPHFHNWPGYWRCNLPNYTDPRPYSLIFCGEEKCKYTAEHHRVCRLEPYRKHLCEYNNA